MCGVAISFWLCYAAVPTTTTTEVIQHGHGTRHTSRYHHSADNAVHYLASFRGNRTTIFEDKIEDKTMLELRKATSPLIGKYDEDNSVLRVYLSNYDFDCEQPFYWGISAPTIRDARKIYSYIVKSGGYK